MIQIGQNKGLVKELPGNLSLIRGKLGRIHVAARPAIGKAAIMRTKNG